jgi:SWI/SNF-related matrix-associated actin-dependent regulator 1 of chromatin subfamily A
MLVGDTIDWHPKRGKAHVSCTPEGKAEEEALTLSSATESLIEAPCPEGKAYLPYQKAGIAYLIGKKGAILGDEMGLGKTIQAIGYINISPEIKSVLVVCPASLVLNWRKELRDWLARPAQVWVFPRDEEKARVSGLGLEVVITNYEQLPNYIERYTQHALHDLLILDEAHYIKNSKRDKETDKLVTKRAQSVFTIAEHCSQVFALTGTPIPTKIKDLWALLQLIAKDEFCKGDSKRAFFRFAQRYCGGNRVRHCWKKHEHLKTCFHYDSDGASNQEELGRRLRATCMVRRLKKDVLKELPPKRRQVIVLEPDEVSRMALHEERQILQHLNAPRDESELYDWLLSRADSHKREKIAFDALSVARHTLALAKLPQVIEHVKACLDSGVEKILVWAHHTDVIEKLGKELSDYGTVRITGETSQGVRHEVVERFQSLPFLRVFIGSITAAGVGLTLTAAQHEVFAELMYNPSDMTQAEDRAHRIGQTGNLLIQILVLEGSLDARMAEILVKKQETADRVLDWDGT